MNDVWVARGGHAEPNLRHYLTRECPGINMRLIHLSYILISSLQIFGQTVQDGQVYRRSLGRRQIALKAVTGGLALGGLNTAAGIVGAVGGAKKAGKKKAKGKKAAKKKAKGKKAGKIKAKKAA